MKNVKVGDILAGSWGYSMTLWSFCEVEKVTAKQVVLRELQNEHLGGEQWNELVRPILGSTDRRGSFRIKNDIDKDYIWDPQYRCLLYPFEKNREYRENHMD